MKKKVLVIGLIAIMLISYGIMINAEELQDTIIAKAKIIADNGIEEKSQNEEIKTIQNVTIRIEEGEYQNEEYEMIYILKENADAITSYSMLKQDEKIVVAIHEKEGEIIDIVFQKRVNDPFVLLTIMLAIFVLILIIDRFKTIKILIVYLIAIIFMIGSLALGMHFGWNLILITSILALIETVGIRLYTNRIEQTAIKRMFVTIAIIAIAGITIYIAFDVIGLLNIQVKLAQNFVNIKDFVCAVFILMSSSMANMIEMISFIKEIKDNKPYKTKSDNIIEGQRSLKL